MTMPSTPLMIAASMSAVCFGVWSCPSLSITVMSPSASASAFIWFIMWTKNGKFSPGTDSRIVSGLPAAPAMLPAESMSPTATAANVVLLNAFIGSSSRC